MGSHALRDLRLREAGIMASLEKGIQQISFLAFNALNLCANGGAAK